MSRARVRAIAALAAASLAGCFSERGDGPTGLSTACREAAEAAGVPSHHVVVGIEDFAFSPSRVEVAPGTTVTWVNCEGQPSLGHTATADDDGWGSPFLLPGQVYSRAFPEAGEEPYHCAPHPSMQGTVVVA